MQTISCTWHEVVPIGEDPAAHGHGCTFIDRYHTITYIKMASENYAKALHIYTRWYGTACNILYTGA